MHYWQDPAPGEVVCEEQSEREEGALFCVSCAAKQREPGSMFKRVLYKSLWTHEELDWERKLQRKIDAVLY